MTYEACKVTIYPPSTPDFEALDIPSINTDCDHLEQMIRINTHLDLVQSLSVAKRQCICGRFKND